MCSYRCASDYGNYGSAERIAKQPEETKEKKSKTGTGHHGEVENPGQDRTIDSSPCDLHPCQHHEKYALFVFVACQASAPDMAKAPLPYQST